MTQSFEHRAPLLESYTKDDQAVQKTRSLRSSDRSPHSASQLKLRSLILRAQKLEPLEPTLSR